MRRILTVLITVLWSSSAFGWGQEGHRIVANIAETRLSPAAFEKVRAILGSAPLASIANRPDQILDQRPETKPWHFTNIDIDDEGYDPARDCANDDCVVARIEEFRDVLADPNAGAKARREALMFLVHFTGDLHQPLHCSDNDDRGGTRTFVTLISTPDQQLHKVWDTLVIRKALKETGQSEIEYGQSIAAKLIKQGFVKKVKGGTVTDWANESHDLGRDDVYPFAEDGVYTSAEVAKTRAIVERRLFAAGVRLAAILNAALK